ncbi:MAG: glycoside hydrolase family 31 protein [Bryobacteraceae bacterium]|nr:glycoside hydrolase family 31 protein [Bryobacteraceae bacterium]
MIALWVALAADWQRFGDTFQFPKAEIVWVDAGTLRLRDHLSPARHADPSVDLTIEDLQNEVRIRSSDLLVIARGGRIEASAIGKAFLETRRTPGGDRVYAAGPNPKAALERLHAVDPQSIEVRRDLESFAALRPAWFPKALDREFEFHILTYLQEINDRGIPPVRPMRIQFPFDPLSWKHDDQFMFGDEILVAAKPTIYLPPGLWTNLRSGREFPGRRTIPTTAGSMFAKNGSIVPLNKDGLCELHYYPKLGAEYFIYEPEVDRITQTHAAPAGDFLRLQIEAAVDRDYVWMAHHVPAPASVDLDGRLLAPTEWSYDPKSRTLRIPLRARLGDNLILSAGFRQGW